jgi:hypothetical protein
MTDVLMPILVVLALAVVTAALSTSYPRAMRPWVWLALAEYLGCAVAQLFYSRIINEGGDTLYYSESGAELAKFLDTSFEWSSRELFAMLFHQASAFDVLIQTPESNSGSMSAVSAFLIFFCRGSGIAAHFVVTGMALFGALNIYKAANDAYPECSPVRMFVATVLFPSIAFWTSALHKEAFAIAGIGALLAAWRSAYNKRIRALVYAPVGLTLLLLFRPPALPPLLLGLAVFFAWDRLTKSRGVDLVLLGPVYLIAAAGVLLLGMAAVSRFAPTLALDRLQETVATSQRAWSTVRGGSSFDPEDVLPDSVGGQIARLPLALLNALFRPQLFDVRSIAALISAIEMTTITYLTFRAVRRHGFGAILVRIQQSPFLLMCLVVTLTGCTMVGLVTFNFGTLARYRVPFLPFYGALVIALSQNRATVPGAVPSPAGTQTGRRVPAGPRGTIARRSRRV